MNKLFLAARFLILPFAITLLLSIVALLAIVLKQAAHLLLNLGQLSEKEVILEILSMVDVALLANLVLLIAFSAYDAFVSDLSSKAEKVRGLEILNGLTLTNVKFKLLGSMIIISAIGLMSSFLGLEKQNSTNYEVIAAQVVIHLTFAVTALLLAFSDKKTDQH